MSDTPAMTAFDYTLDERQRRMLEAMGIQLWLPQDSASAQAAAVITNEVERKISSSLLQEKDQSVATGPRATSATKNVVSIASAPLPTQAMELGSALTLTPRPEGIAQMDWPSLQSAVASCQACLLCASRQNTVFGAGPVSTDTSQAPQVDWLIVGDPPNENEDVQSEPFVDQAGQLLDNMLAAIKMATNEDGKPVGLSRHKGAYITPVIKCRPPANRNPSPEELAMCAPYLTRQIELLRPKIILAMGKFAMASLAGSNEPLGKLRGRVHTFTYASTSVPVIVTYQPSYLLRQPQDKAKAWADLLLAIETYAQAQDLPREAKT
jgi:uracil-DNA glycosylase